MLDNIAFASFQRSATWFRGAQPRPIQAQHSPEWPPVS